MEKQTLVGRFVSVSNDQKLWLNELLCWRKRIRAEVTWVINTYCSLARAVWYAFQPGHQPVCQRHNLAMREFGFCSARFRKPQLAQDMSAAFWGVGDCLLDAIEISSDLELANKFPYHPVEVVKTSYRFSIHQDALAIH